VEAEKLKALAALVESAFKVRFSFSSEVFSKDLLWVVWALIGELARKNINQQISMQATYLNKYFKAHELYLDRLQRKITVYRGALNIILRSVKEPLKAQGLEAFKLSLSRA